eukprot:TRINITY_DN45971_c0_g1_i1.p3 TRINITY_DN45971_c0_g1~~TRINITY_DN45971_c0_g1_i1.p3  ORF type:complete len:124 (-),score=20.45 TRINITY_DN45971_c0_g1_i1:163-534(-)
MREQAGSVALTWCRDLRASVADCDNLHVGGTFTRDCRLCMQARCLQRLWQTVQQCWWPGWPSQTTCISRSLRHPRLASSNAGLEQPDFEQNQPDLLLLLPLDSEAPPTAAWEQGGVQPDGGIG